MKKSEPQLRSTACWSEEWHVLRTPARALSDAKRAQQRLVDRVANGQVVIAIVFRDRILSDEVEGAVDRPVIVSLTSQGFLHHDDRRVRPVVIRRRIIRAPVTGVPVIVRQVSAPELPAIAVAVPIAIMPVPIIAPFR